MGLNGSKEVIESSIKSDWQIKKEIIFSKTEDQASSFFICPLLCLACLICAIKYNILPHSRCT